MNNMLLMSENPYLASLLETVLENHSIGLVRVKDRQEVFGALRNGNFLAVLLDFPNPTYGDFRFWRELIRTISIPIMVLSADMGTVDGVLAGQQAVLQLAKPVTGLMTKLLGKTGESQECELDSGIIELAPSVQFDVAKHSVIRRDRVIPLSCKEFQLLYVLVRHRGCPLSAEELIERAWGSSDYVGTDALYVHIRKLRKKIESDPNRPEILVTCYGKGYMIVKP